MAKKIIEALIDDLDGVELPEGAGEVVSFGLDGVSYEIDLSSENADKLRAALEPFVTAGRKATGATAPRARAPRAKSNRDIGAVREWLRGQGHEVSDRGRIPNSLMAEYDAAH